MKAPWFKVQEINELETYDVSEKRCDNINKKNQVRFFQLELISIEIPDKGPHSLKNEKYKNESLKKFTKSIL